MGARLGMYIERVHGMGAQHPCACAGLEERPSDLATLPVEQRLFYRLLSGMHASVSSHIAANYLIDRRGGAWGLELDEYKRRLGDRPERLHHLHFTYLTVLRALDLAAPTLSTRFRYATGMPREDASVARDVRLLLASQPEWPLTFDEFNAFAGVRCPSTTAVEGAAAAPRRGVTGGAEDGDSGALGSGACAAEDVRARTLMLGAFRHRLHNISRLMNCVGCARCRLWGKLQVHGLGTALRILYAPDRAAVLASLQRHDVVTLFNLLGRLSHSVEVARVVVPLLGAAHSTCSPRGCRASEYEVDDDDGDEEEGGSSRTGGVDASPFAELFAPSR